MSDTNPKTPPPPPPGPEVGEIVKYYPTDAQKTGAGVFTGKMRGNEWLAAMITSVSQTAPHSEHQVSLKVFTPQDDIINLTNVPRNSKDHPDGSYWYIGYEKE